MIITGDFNLPCLNWNHLNYGSSVSGDLAIDIMLNLNLQQGINNDTRGNNVLDLLFLSEIFFDGTAVVEPGVSDHKLISFCWDVPAEMHQTHTTVKRIRDFTKTDDVAIIDYLDTHLKIADNNVGPPLLRPGRRSD